jgi:hypothetical protein
MTLRQRRGLAVILVVLMLVVSGVALPRVLSLNGFGERITNGSFEEGFGPDGVANGWKAFDNGGAVSYGRYDETWSKAIFDGQHAQLIEINSWKWFPTQPDRYSGIYQTISVVPGATYQLVINALMRTTEADMIASGYGYRVQYGIDFTGGQDWQAVANWVDIGLNAEFPRTVSGPYFTYSGNITASGNRLTLFIRGWKKWAQPNREFDLDIDGVSLKGTTPVDTELPLVSLTVPQFPMVGRTIPIHVHASNDVGITTMTLTDNGVAICSVSYSTGMLTLDKDCDWTPGAAGTHTLQAGVTDVGGQQATFTNALVVGNSVEFLTNGNFEGGFGVDSVATGWTGFNNAGQANFGYYQETWQQAVYDGANAQLLEINTLNMPVNDPDRYIGIYQKVSGLTPGAPYLVTINALMRTTEASYTLSGYGYRVQYGIDYGGGTSWQAVADWQDIGLNTEYPRLSPGPYYTYTAWITPTSDTMTLFIRGWKKWAQPYREFDLDLDGLSLSGYQ